MGKTFTIVINTDGEKYNFRARVAATLSAARFIWRVTRG